MCNKMQRVAPLFGQTGLEKVEIQPKSKLSFLIGQACLADELIVPLSRGTSQHDLIKLHDPNLRLATKELGLHYLEASYILRQLSNVFLPPPLLAGRGMEV